MVQIPAADLTTDTDGLGYWFGDGEMNTAYMALDHHVKNGRAIRPHSFFDSPVTAQDPLTPIPN